MMALTVEECKATISRGMKVNRNLRERIADLEQLIRDMHRECTACGYSCRTDNGECGIIQRIRELGIEVDA